MTAQELKNSILQLAIQGKLVKQDPNDEPASVLLEKIKEEREKLIKEKKIKREKYSEIYKDSTDNHYYEKFEDGTVNDITEDIPFEIPDSWSWTRINSYVQKVTDYVASGSFASLNQNVKYYKEKNYALLVRTVDLSNDFQNESVYTDILKAANYSGRAINISKTTAPHAMSYKITSLYGISHGHSVALCLPFVWEYMIHNMNLTIDKRGKEYLNQIFNDLDKLFECQTHEQSVNKFKQILNEIDINCNHIVKENDLDLLTSSVNVERLSNNPVSLNKETIKKIYMKLM
jgi:alcohol dehydrogenase YqhD (iron-dependent ADH family)